MAKTKSTPQKQGEAGNTHTRNDSVTKEYPYLIPPKAAALIAQSPHAYGMGASLDPYSDTASIAQKITH